MAIPEPTFDSRSYREILDEALARIPVHNPDWTNFNDADPGITLLQLFAFMSESIIYRANRIPERNRRKFLRLLGVDQLAATPARGLVTFANPRGALMPVTLTLGREVLAGKVPFRTEQGLQVLPIEARVYYKQPFTDPEPGRTESLYRRLYPELATGQSLDFYQTQTLDPPQAGAALPVVDLSASGGTADTVDGTLWLALLARPNEDPAVARQAIAGQVLTLGLWPAVAEDGATAPGLTLPPGREQGDDGPGLTFQVPNTDPTPSGDPLPRYRPLEARSDRDLLREPGVVELTLPPAGQLGHWDDLDPLEPGVGDFPPSLEDSDDLPRLITWIRIRPAGDGDTAGQRQARFSWLGINAAPVIQQATVTGERLGEGSGEPDQSVTLARRPVIPASVRLTVDGELWQLTDDLAAAAPEVLSRSSQGQGQGNGQDSAAGRVFTLDRQSGEVRFGNGSHGVRPPRGSVIQASYAFGGGPEGRVGIDAITKGPGLPTGIKVSNPLPTYGGGRAETVAEAEQRIPGFIRHRERLVTRQDFLDLTRQTPGVELGRVEVLPLFRPGPMSDQPAPGAVTVLVIPRFDPLQPEAPLPDRLFLDSVCRHLAPRRLVTTELIIRGPAYRDIWLSIGIEVVTGRAQGPVREAVSQAIRHFLSPLAGGFDGQGWPLDKAVEAGEIAAAASRVDGVAQIIALHLGSGTPQAQDPVTLTGLELPRLRGLAVVAGQPPGLAELLGRIGPSPDSGDSRRVAVPVIPESC